MWQYCPHCKTYYYKFGRTYPSCWTFSLWEVPVPDAVTQQRLTALWTPQQARAGCTCYRGCTARGGALMPKKRACEPQPNRCSRSWIAAWLPFSERGVMQLPCSERFPGLPRRAHPA
jgi:hypothetical protein